VNQITNIAWFRELRKEDIPIAGGKGANLGEMYNLKLPIPPGFAVTAQAYKDFLDQTKIGNQMVALLQNLDVNDAKQLQEAADKVQKVMLDAKMPADIERDIKESYDMLNVDVDVYKAMMKSGNALNIVKGGREKPFVAVRSSATAEDLPSASFAGQQATFLNVRGSDDVVKAVQKCWASLYTARAIYYRTKNNFPHEKVLISAIVQRMVNSDAAGVMFSINPSTNNTDEIMIEGAFGLGESVVGGEVTPDTYIIDKKTLKIKSKKIAAQSWGYFRDEQRGGSVKRNLTAEKGKKQKLTDDEIHKLAEYAVRIENHYGSAQDMEWALEGVRMFIVQSRSVTTLLKKREENPGLDGKGEKILDGLAAGPGIGIGKVKIVHDLKELEKIEKGDVLVTRMTSPDMVPAMQKAVAIVTDEGGMTCFSGDTKVLTSSGFFTIKDLFYKYTTGGEFLVLSLDPHTQSMNWRKINGVIRKNGKMVKLQTSHTLKSRQNFIDVTLNHNFITLKDRKLIKKPIKEIINNSEGILICDKIVSLNATAENRKRAYLMGAISSDGHIEHNKSGGYEVEFSQDWNDKKVGFINEMSNCFKSIYEIDPILHKNKRSDETTLTCSRKKVYQDIKAFQEQIMVFVLNADEESLYHFLAGFIDGDGSRTDHQITITIGETKKRFMEAIVCAALRLGIYYHIVKQDNWYIITFTEETERLLQYCQRVKRAYQKKFGNKWFSARQVIGDVIDEVNYRGRVKNSYIKSNALISDKKITQLLEGCNKKAQEELRGLMESHVRMCRVKKEDNSETEGEVYDLWVDGKSELEHNYVVFSTRYTPIIVSNCHAAIVSREMGIPCIVGSEKATQVLKENEIITVDGTHGIVYKGALVKIQESKQEEAPVNHAEIARLKTKTKIYMNLGEPEKIEEYKGLPFDGIGLMRLEFIITSWIGKHPCAMIKAGEQELYVTKLAEGIRKVAQAIQPRPIIVRFSDFKTNEYKSLEGGAEFEPHEENPMIGWRGVSRYIHDDFKEAFRLECKAIKRLHNEGLTNVHVMLPFVRIVDEVKKVLAIMKEEGLENSGTCKVYLMAEVPAIALIPEEFAQLDITGASIGSNDLTQGVLCVDRDSAVLGKMGYFDERNPAVLEAMHRIIRGFQKHGKTVGICGQSVSVYPEITKFLVKEGITSISVSPDVVEKSRKLVSDIE